MRCDMHVHTIHSGMCTVPLARAICRECYTSPDELFKKLARSGMDLVTVTDHDSIDAAEVLRGRPGFFLSEEATCRMPSGTEVHVGIYDITERQHVEIQRRRLDIESLAAYLDEQDLFFTINHALSRLTGRRVMDDFECFAALFPGFEVLNGHMLRSTNAGSAAMAALLDKAIAGGSDAHTLASAGLAWTEVDGARDKNEFMRAVRAGRARVCGEPGNYWKLTRDVFRIVAGMLKENPATLLLAPLAAGVPLVTAANYLLEAAFARRWMRQLARAGGRPGAAAGVAAAEAAV